MLGHAAWQPMHLTLIDHCTPDIRAYRLFPVRKGPLSSFKVGQHVVIQCEIDGNWIERSYTLTSTPKNPDYYEIAVKREEQGLLSRWLFANEENVPFVRVSKPGGFFTFDLGKSNLIICFVAGIGVTPAIALARAILEEKMTKPIHIHVSARSHEHLSYAKELESLVKQSPNVFYQLHLSKDNQRLTAETVSQIAKENPKADFFICGPKSFEDTVKSALQNAGIQNQNILIETFTHSGGPQRT
jgi:ferredoxin-NADP reductase